MCFQAYDILENIPKPNQSVLFIKHGVCILMLTNIAHTDRMIKKKK